ncbi:helix-turn-helix domain-containing protein [Nocardia sp. NPDC004068]|uniref:helix-turn-helix domain-containing protein n=1 Tax=Nocardia sp. NPDC004068 TaxID=3364303 RepID=UPI003692D7D6
MAITKWTGVEVKTIRVDALRVTQRELAEILGVSEGVVQKWEQRGPTITLAGAFAAAMDTLYERLTDAQRDRVGPAMRPETPRGGSDQLSDAIAARMPVLRQVLDRHDLPEDGPVRGIDELEQIVDAVVEYRLNSDYLRLLCELPSVLPELHRARSSFGGFAQERVNALLAQAYRAADAVADKFGYADLSSRIIDMMRDAAKRAGDEVLLAASAYVRTELFFRSRQHAMGRKLLELAADEVDPSRSVGDAAAFGSLHMRAAVVAARDFRSVEARAHLSEADRVASRVPESVYAGTAFGPESVRIHRVSLAVELGDIGAALAEARDWRPSPGQVPAERCSHFYIDVARAHLLGGDHEGAMAALYSAHSVAPQHTHSHPFVTDMLAQLGGWR